MRGAIGEIDLVDRVDLLHLEIIIRILTAEFEDFAEHVGHHQDGRPQVKLETVELDQAHPATGDRVLLENFDVISKMLQANGAGQATDPAPTMMTFFFMNVLQAKNVLDLSLSFRDQLM